MSEIYHFYGTLIVHCIKYTLFKKPFISWQSFGLFSKLRYYKFCYYKHGCAYIAFGCWFVTDSFYQIGKDHLFLFSIWFLYQKLFCIYLNGTQVMITFSAGNWRPNIKPNVPQRSIGWQKFPRLLIILMNMIEMWCWNWKKGKDDKKSMKMYFKAMLMVEHMFSMCKALTHLYHILIYNLKSFLSCWQMYI